MATAEDLGKQIKALDDAGLKEQADEKRAELAKLGGGTSVAPATAAAPADAESYTMDVEDKEAFDRGGDNFGAPSTPCVIPGTFQGIVASRKKPEQRLWIFRPDGQDYHSSITVSPGSGAFKLKELLVNLDIPWTEAGTVISFNIAKGHPCQLDYKENVYDGKTSIRLDRVQPAEKHIEQAV